MPKYRQGKFTLKNPKKYKGDPNTVYYRSGWECSVMIHFDNNPDILAWSSEETIIPYRSPKDSQVHRYFVDFWIKTKKGEFIIEIKPFSQTQPPKTPKRKTKRYINEMITYAVNQAKWAAAEKYAELQGMEFKVLTENELHGLI